MAKKTTIKKSAPKSTKATKAKSIPKKEVKPLADIPGGLTEVKIGSDGHKGTENVFIGHKAMDETTTGTNSGQFGTAAGVELSGPGHVVIGRKAGSGLDVGEFAEVDKVIEKVIPKTDKEIALEEVKAFFLILGNRTSANTADLNKMFHWYTILTGKDPGTISCPACCKHVYNVLRANIR